MPTQDEVNEFLDELREAGTHNMFTQAPSALKNHFGLTRKQALAMWSHWAKNFGKRNN